MTSNSETDTTAKTNQTVDQLAAPPELKHKTISTNTPNELSSLGKTVCEPLEDLTKTYRELTHEADRQLATAARLFWEEHRDNLKGFLWASYDNKHGELLQAAIAASNIRSTYKEINRLNTTAQHLLGSTIQRNKDIELVCQRKKF